MCNDEAALGGLRDAALEVAKSLDDLMNHIRRGTTSMYEGTQVGLLLSQLITEIFHTAASVFVQKVIYTILPTL